MSKPHSFKVPMFHSFEDGTTGEQEVKVTFTSDFTFTVEQPKYIAKSPQCSVSPLAHESVDAAKMHYEDLADRYSRWKLSQHGEKFLMLGAITTAEKNAKDILALDTYFGLGLREVVRLADGTVNLRDGFPASFIGEPILLPDNPEVRAKANSLIASIQTAASLIAGIRQATTPDEAAQYLLSISDGWTRAEPVQTELPLDHPAGVALNSGEFIPAADLNKPTTTPVAEDDDEL